MPTASPIETAVESLLRSIPERWSVFDQDSLSVADQRAVLLLTGAGLVERRISIQLEMAGQAEGVEATFSATGEYGLAQALDPLLAEMWTKWSDAFVQWKQGEASSSSPFRVMSAQPQEWRLTEYGVEARTDLDIEAPSDDAAAFVGCQQRTLEFILKTGHQIQRPPVGGEGRLVQMKSIDQSAKAGKDTGATEPPPVKVAISNVGEVAEAFREALLPEILAAIQRQSDDTRTPLGTGMAIDEVIRRAEKHVRTHDGAFPGRNKLAEFIGCAPSSVTKAIKRSTYLKARKAEHEASKKSGREVHVGGSMDQFAAIPDAELAEPNDQETELASLIAEQRAELRREQRQNIAAKRQRKAD